MKPRSYLYVGLATTLNIIVNALTFGRVLWLEGRVSGGVFRNWARRFGYKPEKYALPTTEAEIISLIKSSASVRLFGAGHSFNDGVVSDETLISLDKYTGVVSRDPANNRLTVRGGTRVRDVIKTLFDKGLAFSSLPSHDAQSIAGIISTDVHGTGKDWGFVSQLVESIKIIDGNGNVFVCQPADDLFKAAIGGIGAVGIISEVTLNAVPRFKVEQICKMERLAVVESNLDRLLEENDHVSLYIFPFADKCQINIWNVVKDKKSSFWEIFASLSISL
ncbi:MAG: FAD-binding protein [Pyrinomonadaceae bacterium]